MPPAALITYLAKVISMRNPYQGLGRRVRLLRRQAGFTQARLAEKADLSDNFIGLIERGKGRPTLEAISRIARALGVRLGELFAWDDDEPQTHDQVAKELRRLLRNRDLKDAQLLLALSKRIFETFPAH
jgi:transcriptional regulator with XRE-family HTH domain